MNLPIDVIPNTDPPRFKWRHMGQDCEGMLPPSVEVAVEQLIVMTKRLLRDNAGLQGQVQGLSDRVVGQSELLSRKAEKQETPPVSPQVKQLPIQIQQPQVKRGK